MFRVGGFLPLSIIAPSAIIDMQRLKKISCPYWPDLEKGRFRRQNILQYVQVVCLCVGRIPLKCEYIFNVIQWIERPWTKWKKYLVVVDLDHSCENQREIWFQILWLCLEAQEISFC